MCSFVLTLFFCEVWATDLCQRNNVCLAQTLVKSVIQSLFMVVTRSLTGFMVVTRSLTGSFLLLCLPTFCQKPDYEPLFLHVAARPAMAVPIYTLMLKPNSSREIQDRISILWKKKRVCSKYACYILSLGVNFPYKVRIFFLFPF